MNKRIKKKKQTISRLINRKRIIKRYPFLILKSHWYTGRILSRRERKESIYGCILIYDDIPKGWLKTLFLPLCEEIRAELIKHNKMKDFHIYQAKEKYARLTIYTNDPTGNIYDIIHKYELISEYVCQICGNADNAVVCGSGWLYCLCKDCANKIGDIELYEKALEKNKIQFVQSFDSENGVIGNWEGFIFDYSKSKNISKDLKLKGKWWDS